MHSNTQFGSFNEAGFLKNINRNGFNHHNSGSEIISNSIDADATCINIDINSENISISDNGTGMNYEDIHKMCDMFGSNHMFDKSIGISGIGGTIATLILSKSGEIYTDVILFTKRMNNPLYKVVFHWGHIMESFQYTGQIHVEEVNKQDEILKFGQERDNISHGTTIHFKYNEYFHQIIDAQFEPKKETSFQPPFKERWDIQFGKFKCKINLRTNGITKQLLPYNYFGANEIDYYTGKKLNFVEIYKDTSGQIHYFLVVNDLYYRVRKAGKGYQTKSFKTAFMEIKPPSINWEHINTITIVNALMKCPKLFDEENPKKLSTASTFLNDYDEQFFHQQKGQKGYSRTHLSTIGIYRNHHRLTDIQLKDDSSSSRGNAKESLFCFHHRTCVEYTTEGDPTNIIDNQFGVEVCKNKNNSTLPPALHAIILLTKKEHVAEIEEHFKNVIELKKQSSLPKHPYSTEPTVDNSNDDDVKEDGEEASQSNDDDVKEDGEEASQSNDDDAKEDGEEASQSNDDDAKEDGEEASQSNDDDAKEDDEEASQSNDDAKEDGEEASQSNDDDVKEDDEEVSQSNDPKNEAIEYLKTLILDIENNYTDNDIRFAIIKELEVTLRFHS